MKEKQRSQVNTHNLDDIDIVIKGLSGDRGRHGKNNNGIGEESKAQSGQCTFWDRSTGILQVTGHACAAASTLAYSRSNRNHPTYAKMPPVAGKRIPNKSWKFSLPRI
jgi:hypothetical protein